MALTNLPSWPAERPRSASLSASPGVREFVGVRPLSSESDTFSALDLEVTHSAVRASMAAEPPSRALRGMLEIAPMKRPQPRRTDYRSLFAESNDVIVAELPCWPANLRLPGDDDTSAASNLWPQGNVTLLRGSHERFVLYGGQERVFGPSSGVSLFSLHDERTSHLFDANLPGRRPVLYGVAKTFAFHELDLRWWANREQRRAGTMRAALRRAVDLEIDFSFVPCRDYRPAQTEGGTTSPTGSATGSRNYRAPSMRAGRPSIAPAQVPARNPFARNATCVEPLAVLQQHDTSGSYLHVLYPMSLLDGSRLLNLQTRAGHTVEIRRASCEQVGHAVLVGPLHYLHRMHRQGVTHQDIKLENMLFHLDWVHSGPAAPAQGHEPTPQRARPEQAEAPLRMLPWAYLADFGHANMNDRGRLPQSTMHWHAPEAFLPPGVVREALARSPDETWPLGSFFSRKENDKWALGLMLMRLLTPALPGPSPERPNPALVCPLVADFHRDVRFVDPITQQPNANAFDDALLADNYRAAQALLAAWIPVHAAWSAYSKTRGQSPRGPRPVGNRLPTPNGARIDEALGEIDALHFDFLHFVLGLTTPTAPRPDLSALSSQYLKLARMLRPDEAYQDLLERGRRPLVELLLTHPVGFAGQAKERKRALNRFQNAPAKPFRAAAWAQRVPMRRVLANGPPAAVPAAHSGSPAAAGVLAEDSVAEGFPHDSAQDEQHNSPGPAQRMLHFFGALTRPRTRARKAADGARSTAWLTFDDASQERAPLLPIARSPAFIGLPDLEQDSGSPPSLFRSPVTPEQYSRAIAQTPLTHPSFPESMSPLPMLGPRKRPLSSSLGSSKAWQDWP